MGCPETGKHAGVVGGVVGKIQEGVVTPMGYCEDSLFYTFGQSSTAFEATDAALLV